VEDLQKEVWGLQDLDVTPLTHLVAAQATGGQLIGAFDHETLVGFVYGFVGIEQGQTTLHSQMLAVKPAYRNLDVGYRLKVAQRERVLAQGLTRITWTFDPLQSVNAYFNFGKLGVVSDSYRVNFYGEETSSFLHRIGTDRLWLTWMLDSNRVRRRLQGRVNIPEVEAASLPMVQVDADGLPSLHRELSGQSVLIQIPADIDALQREHPRHAIEWRETTRRAFTEALASGFLVADFFRQPRNNQSVGVYLLTRNQRIEDLA